MLMILSKLTERDHNLYLSYFVEDINLAVWRIAREPSKLYVCNFTKYTFVDWRDLIQ